MTKLLIVDDDQFFRMYLQKTLESHFKLQFAFDLQDAQSLILNETFDIYIVDVILPSGSGLNLCSFIKSQAHLKNRPIIILSSKNEIQDKIVGLEFGADDYLIKPCHPKELIARIKAQLRKIESTHISEVMSIDNYKIDFIKQRVFDPSGNTIELTQIEFKLLVYFARHFDHALSRSQILDAIWSNNLNVTERVIDTHISNLRKKLGPLGNYIKSVHSVGYSLSKPRAG